MRINRRTNVISQNRKRKKPAATPPSRSAKASLMSAPVHAAKAAAPWAARMPPKRPHAAPRAARSRARGGDGATKDELYRQAKARHIPGRSKMSKQQLENALH